MLQSYETIVSLTDAGLAALRGRLTGLNAAVSIGLARVGNR